MRSPLRSIMWHSLFAVSLILVGFVLAVIQSNQGPGQSTATSGIMMLTGFVWFVLNRLRLWHYRKKLRRKSD